MKKSITILSLILCILISGCEKTVSTPEQDTATESQQQIENPPSPVAIVPNETPLPVADETGPPLTTTTPITQPLPAVVQTPVLSPVPIQTPVPTQSQAVTPTPSSSPTNTPEAVTCTYSVWAESGAVITSVDSTTGEFHYKQKCDACGEVKNGETLSFVRGGSGMTGSFTCSKCGNHQKLVIGWSCTRN